MEFGFLQGTPDTANATTYTFSAQNLGTADADRYIIVCASGRSNATGRTISTITIGGVSATIVCSATRDDGGINSIAIAIAIAAVPTGTTGDIVVTYSGSMLRSAIQAYRAVDINSATPTDTVTSNTGTTATSAGALDVAAGGFAIGCCTFAYATSATSSSWSELTEDHDVVVETFFGAGSSSKTYVGAQTGLTVVGTPSGSGALQTIVGAFAAWEPAPASGFIDNTNPVLRHIMGSAL